MEKPSYLRPDFDAFPADLIECAQWVLWKAVRKGDKWTKEPYNAETGKLASSTNPATWSTFETAKIAYLKGGYAGVGFVLCDMDPFSGFDLDDSYVNEDGSPTEAATEILSLLNSYTERSPSGKGFRVFVRAKLPPGRNRTGDFECYQSGRYLTVTGARLSDYSPSIESRQEEAESIHAAMFAPADKPETKKERRKADALSLSDAELLEKARKAENGAKFSSLYDHGDLSAHGGDHSRADMALCLMLAFWTGNDPARIDSLFRQSALMRDDERRKKWDRLGEETIQRAIALCGNTYDPVSSWSVPVSLGDEDEDGALKEAPKFGLTEGGLSERFVYQHSDNLRYDHKRLCWYVWDGKRWKADGAGQAQEKAKETIRNLFAEAGRLAATSPEEAAALSKHAVASYKARSIAGVLTLAASDPRIAVTPEVWDKDPYLLNCQNGTLDLRTAELKPHDRNDHITRISPVAYNPQAKAPTWEKCLDQWQPDPEVKAFLQRGAGYSLTGDTGQHTAFFLYGDGRNGKGVFTRALMHILGGYAGTLRIDTLMESRKETTGVTPDLVDLPGKRLVIASEVKEGARFNEAVVKDVTGGDRISVNPKYGKVFDFSPQFKIWFFGNHKPVIRGTDTGIWSRFPLVPFTVTIPENERDPNLDAKLRAEAEGILAWAVRGCILWQEKRLSPPEAVVAATNQYRQEQDTFGQFVAACCVLHPDKWTASGALKDAYERWMEEGGERGIVNANLFAERLRRLKCEDAPKKMGGKTFRGWRGIGLINSEENAFPSQNNPPGYTGYTGYAEIDKSPHGNDFRTFIENEVTGVTGVTCIPADAFSEDENAPFPAVDVTL